MDTCGKKRCQKRSTSSSTSEASPCRPFNGCTTGKDCRQLQHLIELQRIFCISCDRLMLDAMPATDYVPTDALQTKELVLLHIRTQTDHQLANQFQISRFHQTKAKEPLQSGRFPKHKQKDLQPLPCAGYGGCRFIRCAPNSTHRYSIFERANKENR
jgi:hypothetical protein